jgi:hypothetical protein
MSMTNYPAEFSNSFLEVPLPQAIRQFAFAVSIANWSPGYWAKNHSIAFDLPSAWWIAGHILSSQNFERHGEF